MKFLLHSHFPAGHVYPMQAVAQALVSRGHQVVWLASADNQHRVAVTGAVFVPTKQIASVDASLAKENNTGLFDRRNRHLEARLLAQVADYRSALADFAAHVLLVDVFPHGARALFELGEIPVYATLGLIPLYTSVAGAPLPGSGACPSTSWLLMLVNYLQHTVNQFLIQPLGLKYVIDKQRAMLGLPKLPYGETMEEFVYSPHLHIQSSSPTLEFRQKPKLQNQRESISFVGPLVGFQNSESYQLPEWWDNVVSHSRVVGITQGTLATDPECLIMPAIEALAGNSDLMLIIVSSHAEDIKVRTSHTKNIHIATWVPYHLLPQLYLLITNGGYGSITQAISYGVPLICAGQMEDKRDTAARVAWCGAGVDLKTNNPVAEQIRRATESILTSPKYHRNALILRDEMLELGGASTACELLEAIGLSCRSVSKQRESS